MLWLFAERKKNRLQVHFEVISPLYLYLNFNRVYRHLELWRLLSSFLFFDNFSLNWVFQMIFLIPNASQLERFVIWMCFVFEGLRALIIWVQQASLQIEDGCVFVDDCVDLSDASSVFVDSVLCKFVSRHVFGAELFVQHCLCLESQGRICADEFFGPVHVSSSIPTAGHDWIWNSARPGLCFGVLLS